MQLNQKLIKDLKEGKIVLENRPKDSDTTRMILKEAFPNQGYTEGYFYYYYSAMNDIDDYECTDSRDYAQSRGKIIPISDFILPENGTITESQTFCGSEKQFEIGKCYEFSDDNEGWCKGKLLAVVDHRDKYVVGFEDVVLGFELIRPVQPKEITRWINVSQSGNQVGKKCYESKMEACQHAPQSQNVFQVKLTGTYTI